ncbi:MAG: hypothetical protein KAY27_01425 [Pedobacter sp.]|nr:hypothetical protein [Pedobacter sp.]
MKKLYSIFLFVCLLSKVSATEYSDSLYFVHANSFIKEVYGEKLKLPRLVLVDQPKFGCDFRYTDTTLFSSEELIAIKDQIKNPRIKSWNKFLKPKKNFIGRDSINNIFKNEYLRLYNGWAYFRKFVGSEINNISAPIFLRDYQYCLFYNDYVCDFKCGSGVLKLYKREDNHWVEVKEICSWIS